MPNTFTVFSRTWICWPVSSNSICTPMNEGFPCSRRHKLPDYMATCLKDSQSSFGLLTQIEVGQRVPDLGPCWSKNSYPAFAIIDAEEPCQKAMELSENLKSNRNSDHLGSDQVKSSPSGIVGLFAFSLGKAFFARCWSVILATMLSVDLPSLRLELDMRHRHSGAENLAQHEASRHSSNSSIALRPVI